MKNLPLSDDMSEREWQDLKTVTRRLARYSRKNREVFAAPRYRPGDVVYFGEALVRPEGAPGTRYRRSVQIAARDSMNRMIPWQWKVTVLAPRFCPERAARRFGRITSVRIEPLSGIRRRGERKREGFPLEDGTTFAQYWERLHGVAPDLRLWVWRIEWVSITREEAKAAA